MAHRGRCSLQHEMADPPRNWLTPPTSSTHARVPETAGRVEAPDILGPECAPFIDSGAVIGLLIDVRAHQALVISIVRGLLLFPVPQFTFHEYVTPKSVYSCATKQGLSD